MPSARLTFRRTECETAIIEAIESTESSAAKGWFSSKFKKMAAYCRASVWTLLGVGHGTIGCGPSQVIYVVAAVVILWQIRGLHLNAPSASGYLVLGIEIFFAITLVLACVKLALGFREFHSQLHNEEYIPSKDPESGARADGGGGDERDDFEDFCRLQGFPLPGQPKSDAESDDEESGEMQRVELRF
ncbi:hypothetical protein V5799_034156 [Amblyomma americanum]|uniref:Uncharacterized protein n=1 Tax=Amblyomma americanum TaxID=6943 RepID=A0AAQ4DL97_AMBAM